jgi:hypothetical protein
MFMNIKSSNIANHRPCDSPSPGGEGRDEGELKLRGHQSALTIIPTSGFWILNSGPSTLSQAIPTYPTLSQPFLEKKDCLKKSVFHLCPSVANILFYAQAYFRKKPSAHRG